MIKNKLKDKDVESNMVVDGGICNIFEVIDEVRNATGTNKDFVERVCVNLKPDFFYDKEKMNNTAQLEFTLLKITMKIAKKGVDMKKMYDSWDDDNSGSLDAQEIMQGVSKSLKINLGKEESHLLAEYLDKDGDGSITFLEFTDKVNFKGIKEKEKRYTISLKNFTDRVLSEWYTLRGEENEKINKHIKEFDDNGDLVF